MNAQSHYALLRYRHDVVSGEALNVGAVVYSWERKYLRGAFTMKGARLKRAL